MGSEEALGPTLLLPTWAVVCDGVTDRAVYTASKPILFSLCSLGLSAFCLAVFLKIMKYGKGEF